MDITMPAGDGKEANAKLADSLRHLVDEAEQTLRSAVDSGDRRFEEMRGQFERQLQRLRLQLDEMEDSVAHKARRAALAADRSLHTHPYAAMGLTAAIGLLAGLLVARRG